MESKKCLNAGTSSQPLLTKNKSTEHPLQTAENYYTNNSVSGSNRPLDLSMAHRLEKDSLQPKTGANTNNTMISS